MSWVKSASVGLIFRFDSALWHLLQSPSLFWVFLKFGGVLRPKATQFVEKAKNGPSLFWVFLKFGWVLRPKAAQFAEKRFSQDPCVTPQGW